MEIKIPAKAALDLSDKDLKAIVFSKRIQYVITSGNNEDLKQIQERITKLWKKEN